MAGASPPKSVTEWVVLGCLAALCTVMAAVAFSYSLSDPLGPGAGFFPFWLGVLGAGLGLALLHQSWRERTTAAVAEALLPRGTEAWRIVSLLAALAGIALALEPLGFRLAMLIFSVTLLLALGVRRPAPIAVFAFFSSFGLFQVFDRWLQVPLPIGWFGI